MKTITICGSLKYKNKMLEIAEQLSLQGNCVILPNFPIRNDITSYTKEEVEIFGNMHKHKIKLSDAIYVVDVDGYIGNATKSEIELATKLNKEIIYYTNTKN